MKTALSNSFALISRSPPRGSSNTCGSGGPIYRKTAAFGHFGRISGDGFTWEATDKAGILKEEARLAASVR